MGEGNLAIFTRTIFEGRNLDSYAIFEHKDLMKSSFTVELKIHCHIFAQFFTDFDDTTTLRMFF